MQVISFGGKVPVKQAAAGLKKAAQGALAAQPKAAKATMKKPLVADAFHKAPKK